MQNKTIKLPREIIANMVGGNQQAIRAIENLELGVSKALPEQIVEISSQVDSLSSDVAILAGMAINALAIAQNAQNQANNGYLGAVGVPCEQVGFLSMVQV